MIRVQREDFDLATEIAGLSRGNRQIGGIVSFVGLVREFAGAGTEQAMTLEHYPGMTERQLAAIEAEAQARWPLAASLIVHRYGRLEPGEQIVLVVAASPRREPCRRQHAREFLRGRPRRLRGDRRHLDHGHDRRR